MKVVTSTYCASNQVQLLECWKTKNKKHYYYLPMIAMDAKSGNVPLASELSALSSIVRLLS